MLMFLYRNSKNEITRHVLEKWNYDEKYFQGYDLVDEGVRTFRRDRIVEMSAQEVDTGQYRQFNIIKREAEPKNKTLSVCFTGFAEYEKEELQKLSKDKNIRVVTAVSSITNFVVAGDNAGPVKLRKASEYGALIMNKEQFINLTKTGELNINIK